jgi:phage baseplate assembly protein V
MTGIVVARDSNKHKVRVQFPDRDGMVSNWLPVGVQKSLGDYEYWLPDLNTQVACLMDENYEFGVVLCAIYSDEDEPPIDNPDLYYKKFKDGTIIQYDRAGHKLTADVKGDVEIIASGTLTATISGNSTITTPLCTLNGNLKVNGHIVASGNVADANGVKTMAGMRQTYNSHTHKDNSHGATTNAPDQGM